MQTPGPRQLIDDDCLEHGGSHKAGHEESSTTASRETRTSVGWGAGARSTGGRSGSRGGGINSARRSTSWGGGERSSDTEARFICVGNAGSEGGKGLGASCWGVNGTVHASLAMGLPGAEEPDGVCGLGHFECENANLTRGSIVGHEWGSESILLGDGVELLGARVGKGALGDGMVSTVELKVDHITNSGGNYLWVKDQSRGTCGIGTNNYGDICTEDGEDTSESGDGGSGELHFWILY